MASPAALLHRDINALLRQLILQGTQVVESTIIIRIEGDPFAPLRFRVDRIQSEGESPFEVGANRSLIQSLQRTLWWTGRLTRQELFREKVMVAARVRIGPPGLDRISASIDEECPVVANVLRLRVNLVAHRNL